MQTEFSLSRVGRGARRAARVALLACAAGCTTSGVPHWAMHVRPAEVAPDARVDEVARRLEGELGRRGLADDHLPAEQLALVAVAEIEQGHTADGALWLSMASYRYHEEAISAADRAMAGTATLPAGVKMSSYVELVKAEIQRYARFNFWHEIDVLSGRVYGHGEMEAALQQQMAALGKTTEIDRELLRDTMWQLHPGSPTAAVATRYPALVASFRQRLQRDARLDLKDSNPIFYLARTPLSDLKDDAVLASVGFFHPGVATGLAEAFPMERAAVVAQLGATRPEVRANAAAVLALAPSEETRAELEKRQAEETDPNVKLVLAYALVHHGVTSNAAPIASALAACKGRACTLPVMLTQWLPSEVKTDVDQAALARLVAAPGVEPLARLFAAAALRDLQHHKPLEMPTVEALITAGRRRAPEEEKIVNVALQAMREATALSREDVLARLDIAAGGPDTVAPAPMLARLTRLATAEDLWLLGRMMARFGGGHGPERELIVEAALRIPGAEADAKLMAWFREYPALQQEIAVGLVARPGVPRPQLAALVAQGGAGPNLIFKFLTKSPDAEAALLGYLQSGSLVDKLAAAEIAGYTGKASAREPLRRLLAFRDARYYPNDAVIRHVAMASLVRLALTATAKPAPTTTAAGP